MRLIDADKLLTHLSDYALQEAPVYGRTQNALAYEAIRNCMAAVEDQETYNTGWISAKSEKKPPCRKWLLAIVKVHSWICDFDNPRVPEEEKTYHPDMTFVTLARYGKHGGWQFIDLTEETSDLYLYPEDFEGDEDITQPLYEVLAWAYLPKCKEDDNDC